MTRQPASRPRARTKPSTLAPTATPRIRLPNSWRIVTARKLRASDVELAHPASHREVPEIRLSGAWLERIGFAKGRRYLISVDREIETIYLQAEPITRKSTRRTP